VADAPVPDDAASLRAANARLRALLAERDAEIAERDALITVLRGKSGRKPGRPKGQPDVTMQLCDSPDRVVRHEPTCCAGCSAGLAGAPEAGVIRRQVTEIPPVRAEVTEHQVIGRRRGCGTVTWADAPEGVTAPVQYGPRAAAIGAYLWHGQFLSRTGPAQRWRTCSAVPPRRALWPP
jgi:transposase